MIVAETLAIVRREGLKAATMRRVAHELDTGAASLYVYVANTTELQIAVLDAFLEGLAPPTRGDWRARIEALLADYRDRLTSYPELARAALAMHRQGPMRWRCLITCSACSSSTASLRARPRGVWTRCC